MSPDITDELERIHAHGETAAIYIAYKVALEMKCVELDAEVARLQKYIADLPADYREWAALQARVDESEADVARLKWLLNEAEQFVPESMRGEISNAVNGAAAASKKGCPKCGGPNVIISRGHYHCCNCTNEWAGKPAAAPQLGGSEQPAEEK